MTTAMLRARQVLREAGITADVPLERADSARNEVWLAGPLVVRIATSPASRRLSHERVVRHLLGKQVPVPALIAQGLAPFGEWEVQHRMPGRSLARVWPSLATPQRRTLVLELAHVLRQIHRVDAGGLVAPFDDSGSIESPHLLPLDRLQRGLAWLRSMGCLDRGVLTAAEDFVARHGELVASVPSGLVHGDFHLENVLVDGGHVSAVLDFEFAHRGWPAQDLEVLARFCSAPQLSVASDYASSVRAEDFRPVVGWIREGYLELFADPDLVTRVNLCSLAYDVRELIADPPRRDRRDLAPFHAANRLARLMDGRGLLQLVEWV